MFAILPVSVAGLLPAAPPGRATAARPATRATTGPAGTWRFWSDCRWAKVLGCGGGSIWFGGAGLLWRYDLRTQRIRAFTPRDGLPLEWCTIPQIAVARDETCAVRFFGSGGVYLWRPGGRWRAVAPPKPGWRFWRFAAVDFDARGRLHGLMGPVGIGQAIYRRDGRAWTKVRDVGGQHMFLLEGGYVVAGPAYARPVYVPAAGGPPVPYRLEKGLTFRRTFRAGGKTLGLFEAPDGRRRFYRITPEKLVFEAEAVGLDLTGKGFLKLTGPAERGGRIIPGVASTVDGQVAGGLKLPTRAGLFVRDANRHIWCGPNRWDGRAWKLIVPDGHLADCLHALDRRKFAFDASAMTWKRIDQHVPEAMRRTYNRGTQTAWRKTKQDGREVWQHVKLTSDGPRVLRSVPTPNRFGGPELEDAAGQWWWIGMPRRSGQQRPVAVRFDRKSRVHTYPARKHERGWWPQVIRSPKGNAWLWDRNGYSRYDARQDKFVPAEPYEEFSFQVGRWKLALTHRSYPAGRKLFVNRAGKWGPMKSPFGAGEVGGNRHMALRGRMLLTVAGVGVVAYDGPTDRWTLLHEYDQFACGFDAEGRHILVGSCGVLLFEGDPFHPGGGKADALFNELLRLMDDDSWRVRDAATRRLEKLYFRAQRMLEEALKRKDLSLEVRTRLERVLAEARLARIRAEARDAGRGGPVSLFRRMHPLVK